MGEKRGAASRRTVLRTAGAVGGLAGLAGITGSGRAQATEIALDGATSGWVSRSPESIAGETNPTLSLEAGRTYRVTWTNADGVPHSFVIEDADGNRLAGTEIAEEEGASLTLEFEATPAMAEYYCEVHPQTMRGSVAVGGGAETGGTTAEGTTGETTVDGATETTADGATETTADGATETTEEGGADEATGEGPPPVIDAETIVLGAQAAFWLGLAPGGIQGRPNPTLRLREGREYELVWINLDGVEHDFHLVDDGGEDLADTSAREDAGDTHDTDVEATVGMAEYLCAFHPQSMRGGVEVV